jgi:predicted transposase YdaD
MELTTSWMRQGIQQGLQQGRQEGIQIGEAQLVARLLRRRLGTAFVPYQQRIEQLTLTQLEDLSEALLDFTGPDDLTHWLAQHDAQTN